MDEYYERKTIACFHRLDVMKIVNILKDSGWKKDGPMISTVVDYRQKLIRKKK